MTTIGAAELGTAPRVEVAGVGAWRKWSRCTSRDGWFLVATTKERGPLTSVTVAGIQEFWRISRARTALDMLNWRAGVASFSLDN